MKTPEIFEDPQVWETYLRQASEEECQAIIDQLAVIEDVLKKLIMENLK